MGEIVGNTIVVSFASKDFGTMGHERFSDPYEAKKMIDKLKEEKAAIISVIINGYDVGRIYSEEFEELCKDLSTKHISEDIDG